MGESVYDSIPRYIHWPGFADAVATYPVFWNLLETGTVFGAVLVILRLSNWWKRLFVVLATVVLLYPVTCTSGLMYNKRVIEAWQEEVARDGVTLGDEMTDLQRQVVSLPTNEFYYYRAWYFVLLEFVFCFLAIYAVKIPYRIGRWGWRRWRSASTQNPP